MYCQPISPISFGYSHKLKTLYKKGLLTTVTKGLYGSELTIDTVSLEHLKPHSLGGHTTLSNLALATISNNSKRGVKDITEYLTSQQAIDYLDQFKNIKLKNFNGNHYIDIVTETLKKLGIKL